MPDNPAQEIADMTYNGWKNYETWLIALWIDNEQRLQEEARMVARYAKRKNLGDNTLPALSAGLKQWVDDWHDVFAVSERGGFVSDLLNAAMSEIDWYELAEHYLEDIKDEEGEDDEE